MKFVHVSDIHIGITPDPTKEYANDRALDIIESFANVIKKCKEVNADLLLISGDLFNHQPLTKDLNDINELFKTIPDTRILIVAGSCDCIKQNSPVLSYAFSENVYYFMNQFPEDVTINDKNVVVHGFSYYSQEETNSLIDSINVEKDDSIHILLAYAGDTRHCPIDIHDLSKKDFAYCALGSNHAYQELIKDKAIYPGSLEPLSQNEMGEHGVIIGEINDTTHRLSHWTFEPLAKVSYIPLSFKINGNTTQDNLVEMLTKEVIQNNPKNIFKIELVGMRNPDIEFSPDLFNKRIRICDFIDNSEPKYDFVKLSKEHPQDMIGAFIRKITSSNIELSDIEKKALYYGVHSLIKSSERLTN